MKKKMRTRACTANERDVYRHWSNSGKTLGVDGPGCETLLNLLAVLVVGRELLICSGTWWTDGRNGMN